MKPLVFTSILMLVVMAADTEEDMEITFNFKRYVGYIDVGDGCWRPNVLVTSLRCW